VRSQTWSTFPVVVGVALALVAGGVAQAGDAWLGTWKLNLAKSSYNPGPAPSSGKTRFEIASLGRVKVVSDGVDAAGRSTHNEIVTMFDGKPSELKGTDPPVTLAFSRIDDHRYELVTKVNGKVTATSICSIAGDGKTRTLVTKSLTANGEWATSTAVYDRQ